MTTLRLAELAAEHPARRACSTSSPARQPDRARRCRPPRRRHGLAHRLGRHRQAVRARRPPTRSSACTSSSAARRRSWCSTTSTWRRALETIAGTGYYNAGQDCTAATRVLAGAEGLRRRRRRPGRAGQGLVIGDTLVAGHDARPAQLGAPARARRGLPRAPARRTPRSSPAASEPDRPGFFLEPTVVAGLQQDDEMIQREIFGPVITVQRFTDEEEAIALGQRHAATAWPSSVWTRDVGRALRVSQARCASAACGSTTTSRSSPRCRTAASRSPATARTCRVLARGLHGRQARDGEPRRAGGAGRPRLGSPQHPDLLEDSHASLTAPDRAAAGCGRGIADAGRLGARRRLLERHADHDQRREPPSAVPAASTPYPSAISLSGITGPVTAVSATLHGFAHDCPTDVDMLLVVPRGQESILMSDSGDCNETPRAPVDLAFSTGGQPIPCLDTVRSRRHLRATRPHAGRRVDLRRHRRR